MIAPLTSPLLHLAGLARDCDTYLTEQAIGKNFLRQGDMEEFLEWVELADTYKLEKLMAIRTAEIVGRGQVSCII